VSASGSRWANAAVVRSAVEQKWDRGSLLRDLHTPPPERTTFPLRIRLSGPTREDLPLRFAEASAWVRDLKDAAAQQGWELQFKPMRVGGLGTQDIPVAAIVPTAELALALLGRTHTTKADRFAAALRRATTLDPAAARVALDRPHDVLSASDDWPLLLDLADWIRHHPRPGIFVRQIPVAGVHTKVLEQHTALLTRLLEALLPAEAVDPTGRTFAARFGFASAARRVRLRADPAVLGVPTTHTADVEWDIAALVGLDPHRHRLNELLVLENKTSFLTVPVSPRRLVVWGAGYGVDELLAAVPWRDQIAVRYWGDIDTHGFVMLARVRAIAPHAVSVLMDTDTLLQHRPFWSTERAPRTDLLPTLTGAEQDLYTALCAGRYGPAVRLEQELLRFDLVEAALKPEPAD
jgi:hypothetical protein